MTALDRKPHLPQPGRVLDAVGIVNFAGGQSLAGGQQFAAGSQHTDGQRPVDRHFRKALPRQHTEVRRGQHRARIGNEGPGGDVLAPEDHIRVVGKFGVDAHVLFPAVGQFLHQDAVSPGGQGCPGHDPGRTPGGQGRRRRVTRIQLHHHGQGLRGLLPGPGRVRAVEGVAVQGAAVEGRLVHPGAQGRSSNAANGFVQPGILNRRLWQLRRRVQHTAQRLSGRTKRLFHLKNILHFARRNNPPLWLGQQRFCGFHRFSKGR